MRRRCIELLVLVTVLAGCASSPELARQPATAWLTGPVDAEFERAREKIVAGDLAAAEVLLIEFTGRWPGYASGWTNLGYVLRQRGKTEEALTAFEQAIAVDAGDCIAANHLAGIRRERYDFGGAEAAWRQCLEHDPANAAAWLNLGILYELNLGELAQALAAYEQYQAIAGAEDERVSMWIADLTRRIERSQHLAGNR